jgi:uncharacterized cupredoxin-like copper-binding protein
MKTKFFLTALATLVFSAILLPASAAKTHAHPKVSMAQAKAIAKKTVPGKFKSSELENENGKSIYSFDIQAKDGLHEVNIDANSGEVLENKIETPADEAKEKAADQAAKPAPKPY